MDLGLSETQSLLKSGLQEFLAREVSFERVREIQRRGGADTELWQGLQRTGWLALPFSELSGGAGAGLVDLALATEEITRSAAVLPFVETMTCAMAIADRGDPRVLETVAAAVQAGTMTLAPALLETAGRYGAIAATVSGGSLTGTKKFVDFGQTCSHHLVHAIGDEGPGLYLVAAETEAVRCTPLDTIGRTPQANVDYRGAAAGFAGATGCFDRLLQIGTVLCCAQLLSCAQKALDLAVDYVAGRVQFGRPLGTFQAVQHHCADMATAVEATRVLVYEAAWQVERGEASADSLALVKAAASRTGVYVTTQAHQLHGGIGVTDEYPLQLFSRRAKERSVAWGSLHESLQAVAGTVERAEAWV